MARQAGSAYVDFTARTGGVVVGMDEARRATRQAAREMKADIQEAKASIALLGEEVGVKLPRHLRSFVAELPGVASAMAAAFSGAAILGLGQIAVEQATKMYEAFMKVAEAGEKSKDAFADFHTSLLISNAELIKTNDALANTIAKFEGRKENTLQIRLDDATIAAGKLAKALKAAALEEEKLFKEESVSFLAQMMGEEGTGDLQKHAKEFYKGVVDTARDALEEIAKARDAGDEKHAAAVATQTNKELKDKIDAEKTTTDTAIANAKREQEEYKKSTLASRTSNMLLQPGGMVNELTDQSQLIQQLTDHKRDLIETQRTLNELLRQGTLEGIKNSETGLSASELAKKAAEAAAKAARIEVDLHKKSREWWDDFYAHRREQETQFEDFQAGMTKQAIADAKKEASETARANKEVTAAEAERLKGNRDGYSAQYSEFAANEQLMVETGKESNSDRIDNLKTALQTEQDALQASFDAQALMYAQDSKEWIAVQIEKEKAAAQFDKQIAALSEEQRRSGIGGAMDDMRARAMDTAGTIKELFTSTLGSINDQLVNLMTGKKTDFKGMASGIASSVARAGLTTAEGKLLGTNKPDGSVHAPFHVIDVNDPKKTGTDILGAAKGSPDPSTTNDGGGLLGSVGNTLFSTLMSMFIPHASGGPVMPGHAYLVGERGPEPFFPGVSGTVGTNAAMSRAFGSTMTQGPTYVDARGSNDPAAVNAAVHRAMRSYVPVAVGASVAYQHDMKRRIPASNIQNM